MNETVFKLWTESKDPKGFKVHDLFNDGLVRIALPSRTSLTIAKIGKEVFVRFDLGHMPGDDKGVCEIDLLKINYADAVRMTDEFIASARPHDNHFHLEKAVGFYYEAKQGRAWSLLGDEWLDQVWINLEQPTHERLANIEFSIRRAKAIDDEPLDEPALTLLGSVQLYRQMPHYFMFVAWWQKELWSYRRNFFYNNALFPAMKQTEVAKVA